jgi:tetratricopeptide (TPR) repeat protein
MDYLSLCLICKDENDYLPEWLNYHILMGVDRFYIYDNESRVSLRESLKEYIARGWVVVVDIPGSVMQLYAYDHCLQTFGPHTFWMGFIDTDEFLVPKTTLDLKELLKDYEAYGGLAVSALFFGSNGHKTRPSAGQIAAYTRHTHATLKQNLYVKSIVQPGLVLMPNTPHDFTYINDTWCVNEGNLRVDFQCFPNYTTKIQLNHYYCRSEDEIDLKLGRGNSQIVAWPRKRFEVINSMATYKDTAILKNLEILFQKAGLDVCGLVESPLTAGLLEKMSVLAHARQPAPLITGEMIPPCIALSFRAEFSEMDALKAQTRAAINRKEFDEVKRLMLLLMQRMPQNIVLHTDLAAFLLDFGDHEAAWQMLSQAWLLSPNNNYNVLSGMAFYFIRVENYSMAENICRLLLGIAPHELTALGLLTYSLMGQGRYEEALKVGVPVIELDWQFYELPDGMGVFLVKKMADYLLEKKDYTGAVRLWEVGVKCQPGDVNPLLELSQALLLAGDKTSARQRLFEAQVLAEAGGLASQSETVLALPRTGALAQRAKKVSAFHHPPSTARSDRRLKRRH